VIFLLLPDLEILDLAGPLQVLHEANNYGSDFAVSLCAGSKTLHTTERVLLGELQPLGEVAAGDLVIIPGVPFASLSKVDRATVKWVRQAFDSGARLCSICTGAFVLGQAGLLSGRQCTTHWNRIEQLQQRFPRAKVVTNRLFVEDGPVTTSAGMTAGIDLTLSIVEQYYGPRQAAAVAREMVVYIRRDGSHKQDSVYLDYRSHLNPGIHRVQDILSSQPERRQTLRELASVGNMSERNLTRVFRQTTGISIGEYVAKLRVELASSLLADPQLSLEAIATRCGFESGRQLRRTWKKVFGLPASQFRRPHRTSLSDDSANTGRSVLRGDNANTRIHA
jgi:transcriptional regulator GlxA family with amidase domain